MLTSRVTALLFLTLACLLASCDTTADAPPDNPSAFRIVSILGDSLYRGEELRIVASGAGEDTAQLKLLLNSIEAQITIIIGDTISARIPHDAESGIIKLYQHDSILAAGEHSITIIPQHVDDLTKQAISLRYQQTFRGDSLRLIFEDAPLTDRPIAITLNERPLAFSRGETETLIARVPDDAKSGELKLYLFGKLVLRRPMEVALDPVLLREGTISKVTFSAYGVAADLERAFKTPTAEATEAAGTTLNESTIIDMPPGGTVTHSGDTLIIDGSRFENGFAWRMQARLVPAGGHQWSGRISCMKIENYGAWNATGASFCIEMNAMRWKKQDGKYVFYATDDDIQQSVADLCFQHLTTSGGYGIALYLVRFHRTANHHPDSKLEITLEP